MLAVARLIRMVGCVSLLLFGCIGFCMFLVVVIVGVLIGGCCVFRQRYEGRKGMEVRVVS